MTSPTPERGALARLIALVAVIAVIGLVIGLAGAGFMLR